jgi:hypothetical protein
MVVVIYSPLPKRADEPRTQAKSASARAHDPLGLVFFSFAEFSFFHFLMGFLSFFIHWQTANHPKQILCHIHFRAKQDFNKESQQFER